VGWAVDGGAAAVETESFAVDRLKFAILAGEGVEEKHGKSGLGNWGGYAAGAMVLYWLLKRLKAVVTRPLKGAEAELGQYGEEVIENV